MTRLLFSDTDLTLGMTILYIKDVFLSMCLMIYQLSIHINLDLLSQTLSQNNLSELQIYLECNCYRVSDSIIDFLLCY